MPRLQGVETRRGEAAKALLSWPAAVWVAASSLLITPLAALSIQLLPLAGAAPGLALGLAAWYCVPTTLSRSIALTEVGGYAEHLPQIPKQLQITAPGLGAGPGGLVQRINNPIPQHRAHIGESYLHLLSKSTVQSRGRQHRSRLWRCSRLSGHQSVWCHFNDKQAWESSSHFSVNLAGIRSACCFCLQRAGGNAAFVPLTAFGINIAALAIVPLIVGPLPARNHHLNTLT